MAVHNGEQHLRASIESILRQTFRDFELVIVDDGSTDGTAAILDAYEDDRIVLHRSSSNVGLTASLNRGLEQAQGRYVARQDDDDISEPDRLERQVSFLEANGKVALLAGAYRRIDGEGTVTATRTVPTDTAAIRWRLLFLNAFTSSSVVFRRDVVTRLGGYDEDFPFAQDYDLWSRIARTEPVAALTAPLVRYRHEETSMTATVGRTADDVDRISRDNIRRLGGAGARLAGTIDRDAAWRLLFASSRGIGRRRAAKVARDVLALRSAFAEQQSFGRARRLSDRAALSLQLVRAASKA
jgi:glycosyltransferase involved in cell wall biosynthesis